MAATDQTYRNQRALDVAFGVSSLLMLASIVLMFAQDYFRPWKTEQRAFMKVESVMAERDAFEDVISMVDRYDAAMLKVVTQLSKHKEHKQAIADLDEQIKALTPKKEIQKRPLPTSRPTWRHGKAFITSPWNNRASILPQLSICARKSKRSPKVWAMSKPRLTTRSPKSAT